MADTWPFTSSSSSSFGAPKWQLHRSASHTFIPNFFTRAAGKKARLPHGQMLPTDLISSTGPGSRNGYYRSLFTARLRLRQDYPSTLPTSQKSTARFSSLRWPQSSDSGIFPARFSSRTSTEQKRQKRTAEVLIRTHTRTHTHTLACWELVRGVCSLADLTQWEGTTVGGKFSGNGTEVNKMKGGNGNRF